MHDWETAYLSAAYVTGPEAFGIRMDIEGKGIGAAYGAKWLGARTCLGTKVRTLEFQTTEVQARRMENDLQDAGFDTVVRVLA
jgi:hypothetical protein